MSTKRSMPARRTERQRPVADPPVPPAPPKGKRGAGVSGVKRSKEPLGGGRKIKGS